MRVYHKEKHDNVHKSEEEDKDEGNLCPSRNFEIDKDPYGQPKDQ